MIIDCGKDFNNIERINIVLYSAIKKEKTTGTLIVGPLLYDIFEYYGMIRDNDVNVKLDIVNATNVIPCDVKVEKNGSTNDTMELIFNGKSTIIELTSMSDLFNLFNLFD